MNFLEIMDRIELALARDQYITQDEFVQANAFVQWLADNMEIAESWDDHSYFNNSSL